MIALQYNYAYFLVDYLFLPDNLQIFELLQLQLIYLYPPIANQKTELFYGQLKFLYPYYLLL